ncbi:aspartyl protease family protein [Caulobacter segnis]|uniref:aspartyl protease family protein n=1 Tax=Caulobacter segnis TaxID=88688 RepID=UPI00240EBEB6|nr:aspartyl protease family protein [Caulobacter segnis]MDG2521274.1 aspartyl protease family protein [Caulobacter segnis]
MVTRRALFVQLGLVGAGFAAAWTFREQIWSAPDVAPQGAARSSGWLQIAAPQAAILTIEGRIGQNLVRVLVDTGAERSVIHAGTADRLGLKVEAGLPMAAVGLGGGVAFGGRAPFDLSLGDLDLVGLNATRLDLGPLAQAGPFRADVVLGRDALSAMIIELDLPNRRLALSLSAQRPRGLRARFGGAPLMTEVDLEGRSLRALVDSGASGYLTLSHTKAAEYGLHGRAGRNDQSIVLGGTVRTRSVTIDSLKIAGRNFADVSINLLPQQQIPGAPDAIAGLECFRSDLVTLDLGAGSIVRRVSQKRSTERLDVLEAPLIGRP